MPHSIASLGIRELAASAERHVRPHDPTTAIPDLFLSSPGDEAESYFDIADPLVCLVVRGRKRLLLGEVPFDYDPGTFLIVSVAMPVTARVLESPCLGVTMRIDRNLLADLAADLPADVAGSHGDPRSGLAVYEADSRLTDGVARLVGLLDRPNDIAIVAPLVEREILYYLLAGPSGERLVQMASASSRLAHMTEAIAAIRRDYAEPLRPQELAGSAGMSLPTFYRNFAAIMHMSPLQYQKRIRLHEARRMLFGHATDVAGVGYAVGYESPSQFSREYRRLFGTPPSRANAS